MSARCSSCHCYSRNAPEGLPNHKDNPVGPSCPMNGKGLHYRDQGDTANPSCDYEAKGQKCDFFTAGHEHSLLPYPSDISVGPVISENNSNGNTSDISEILVLLQQQKADSEKQFSLLQTQINSLTVSQSSAASPAPENLPNVAPAAPLTSAPTPTPPVPGPAAPAVTGSFASAPNMVSAAASALTSHLSTGLGHTHNLGYQALTMDQLRRDPNLLAEANRLLNNTTQNIPPLNPLAGMGAAMGAALGAASNVSTVDQLYAATMRNKQLKAWEFAATGQFSYKNQLRQDNTNAITFAFGSFKHLEAAKMGLIHMPDDEFLARLRHLKNTFEVACLSSNLASFCDHSWMVAREYDNRVIADIESGAKTWSSLSNGLETDAIYCANQICELKKAKKSVKDETKKVRDNDTKKGRDNESKSRPCTTYNTHRASEGCVWEQNNEGKACVFRHYCSWCKAHRDVEEKHKASQCEHKTE